MLVSTTFPSGGARQSDWHQFIQVRGFPGDLAGRTVFLCLLRAWLFPLI